MLQEWIALLPAGSAGKSPVVAGIAAAAGVVLWLGGARYSRGIVTLCLVATGASVGVRLPRWNGWPIDGAAVGIALAMAGGVCGFFLHRTWIAAFLGLLLAMWGGAAVWMIKGGAAAWTLPSVRSTESLTLVLSTYWESLPAGMNSMLAVVCVGGFIIGILAALFWPRLSRVVTYDLLGISVLMTAVLPFIARKPAWSSHLPKEAGTQLLSLLGMIVVGALAQWWMTPPLEPDAPFATWDAPVARPLNVVMR